MTQSVLFLTTILVFAILVMAALLDIKRCNFTRKVLLQLAILTVGTVFVNLLVLSLFGLKLYRSLYFILIQLPVFIAFWFLSDYRGIKLLFTLLTTIVLSSIPVEFSVAARVLSHNNPLWILAGLLLSYILSFLLVFRLRPNYLYMLKYGDSSLFRKFCSIPILYYLYAYFLSGYDFTQTISMSTFITKGFPMLIVFVSYLLFFDIYQKTHEAALLKEQEQQMRMRFETATEQLELLRAADKQSAIYRHDLRHHMNYLNACINTGKLAEASEYISQLSREMDQIHVITYCSNESMNLVLSHYAAKAQEAQIPINFDISEMDYSRFQIIDLCSLLSNALENAFTACKKVGKIQKCYIHLRIYEKNKKFCLHISNSYLSSPVLEQGIPVTSEKEHGFGTLSMIHVVEKYHGVYAFYAENGKFIFQASM